MTDTIELLAPLFGMLPLPITAGKDTPAMRAYDKMGELWSSWVKNELGIRRNPSWSEAGRLDALKQLVRTMDRRLEEIEADLTKQQTMVDDLRSKFVRADSVEDREQARFGVIWTFLLSLNEEKRWDILRTAINDEDLETCRAFSLAPKAFRLLPAAFRDNGRLGEVVLSRLNPESYDRVQALVAQLEAVRTRLTSMRSRINNSVAWNDREYDQQRATEETRARLRRVTVGIAS